MLVEFLAGFLSGAFTAGTGAAVYANIKAERRMRNVRKLDVNSRYPQRRSPICESCRYGAHKCQADNCPCKTCHGRRQS